MKIGDSGIYLGLKESLESEGMVFGLDPTGADHLLAQRIGRKRYQKFYRVMDRVRDGSKPIAEAYRMFSNILDANSLMSAQGDVGAKGSSLLLIVKTQDIAVKIAIVAFLRSIFEGTRQL
jgi:hypothetical protein